MMIRTIVRSVATLIVAAGALASVSSNAAAASEGGLQMCSGAAFCGICCGITVGPPVSFDQMDECCDREGCFQFCNLDSTFCCPEPDMQLLECE